MIKRKKHRIFLASFFLSCCAYTQQFHYSALLDTVGADGFYSIPITPSLSSYLKTDLSDVRIADEKNQWTPHIVNWSMKNYTGSDSLVAIPVISKEGNREATIIRVVNAGKLSLSNLLLLIRNTAAARKAVVSGSDDGKSWFSITDSIQLVAGETTLQNKPAISIRFPEVNYSYFKLTISNASHDPLNILSVMSAVPVHTDNSELFIENPLGTIDQRDTMGYSIIHVQNSRPFHFNKFYISVTSPKFYDRRAKLFTQPAGGSFTTLINASPVLEYILSASQTTGYTTPWLNAKDFYLLIENNDNPPLQVSGVRSAQTQKDLIAYLEKGKQYKLLFGDSLATAPTYDLLKFKDKIPASLPILIAKKITSTSTLSADKTESNPFKKWLWPSIIAVLLLLAYFTGSLIKDMQKNKRQ